MPASIEIIPAHQIDQTKWDRRVELSENGLIYSQSAYLNTICDNWHGVVLNDYEAIMALPWRKKMGIRYLYQPAFIQQLGVMGSDIRDKNLLWKEIFSFSKYGDLLLNFSNTDLAPAPASLKTNFIIDLSKGYEQIFISYKKDLQQNLKKAQREEMITVTGHEIELAVSAYISSYKERFNHVTARDYNNFKNLCFHLQEQNRCFTKKVVTKEGALLSIGLFLEDAKRIYNIMNTTTAKGRGSEANHFLLDAVIREYAGRELLFDFEGSDLPGVRNFYEKFGAVNQPYFHFHFNKLPPVLRWFKR